MMPTWDDYLAVALDEIIALPALSPTISSRVIRLIDELAKIAPGSNRPQLDDRRKH